MALVDEICIYIAVELSVVIYVKANVSLEGHYWGLGRLKEADSDRDKLSCDTVIFLCSCPKLHWHKGIDWGMSLALRV